METIKSNPYRWNETLIDIKPHYAAYRAVYENNNHRKTLAKNPLYKTDGPTYFYSRKTIYKILNIPESGNDPDFSKKVTKGLIFRHAKVLNQIILIASPSDTNGASVGIDRNFKSGSNLNENINDVDTDTHITAFNSNLPGSLETLTGDFIFQKGQLMYLLGHSLTGSDQYKFEVLIAPESPMALPNPIPTTGLFFSLGFKDGSGANTREYMSYNCPPRCY